MRLLGAVDDLGQKPLGFRGVERVEDIRRIFAAAVVAKGEIGFGWVRDPGTRELEIEPVLAVMRRSRPGEQVRRVALEPGELDILLAGIHARAGALIMRRVRWRAGEFL